MASRHFHVSSGTFPGHGFATKGCLEILAELPPVTPTGHNPGDHHTVITQGPGSLLPNRCRDGQGLDAAIRHQGPGQ